MSITVEVDLEPWEVLDQLTDKQLLEEIRSRKLSNTPAAELIEEIKEAFEDRDEVALLRALDKIAPEQSAERIEAMRREYNAMPRWSC